MADNNVRPPAVHDATLLVFFRPISRPVQTSYGQAENRMLDVTIECTIAGRRFKGTCRNNLKKNFNFKHADARKRHEDVVLP